MPTNYILIIRVSDASGKMEISKIAEQDLSSDALDSKDAFILDTGREIFVWVGKSCTMEERQKAMSYAQVKAIKPISLTIQTLFY